MKSQYAVASSQSGKNGGFFGMQVERLDPETQKVYLSVITIFSDMT